MYLHTPPPPPPMAARRPDHSSQSRRLGAWPRKATQCTLSRRPRGSKGAPSPRPQRPRILRLGAIYWTLRWSKYMRGCSATSVTPGNQLQTMSRSVRTSIGASQAQSPKTLRGPGNSSRLYSGTAAAARPLLPSPPSFPAISPAKSPTLRASGARKRIPQGR